jgi:hypothetical protein
MSPPQLGIRDVILLALRETLDLAASDVEIFAGAPAGQRQDSSGEKMRQKK